MSPIFASELAGDPVMTTEGVEIGTLENVTVDPETGTLDAFIVVPNSGRIDAFDRNEEGQLLVPATSVKARSDYLLVEPDGG
ncbi:Protein implicated in RNA metabolism, contains PRC-barrel domain [Halalkaliarchaeum sp. AArc-CO]|uniref:PRC-barrel domain-containing protein n=1 Tax=Halalkaliarchaeum sp. AArc-CO TaxID=2866381 RepID=UPI00217D8DD2|nr:PRC-barrel domain-containing protein [Halalkaliarchaeum sp. AArc-CO]UWG51970.1 Protein implicated in RNA metabolism, contains PRC-barrel domain [Halalkaliarchaeum sp. AArc-CO]